MLSRRKTEGSERKVHESNLQRQFTRSVRKFSLREHKRENNQTKVASKITTNKTNTSGARK